MVRTKSQLNHFTSESEITYVKLNGCKTDLGKYPLVFSTDDFAKQKSYYKMALTPLRSFSPEVAFIAFGYSFSDTFSEHLFDLMEKQDYRQRKPIYCVDPYVNEDKLDYYKSKNILIFKISFSNFFESYQTWFESNHKNYLKALPKFSNPDNSKIKVNSAVRLTIGSSIVQMNEDYFSGNTLSKRDFYIGEEPSYKTILNNHDVVRKNDVANLKEIIKTSLSNRAETFVPRFIIAKGTFGIGKTTLIYRAIHDYLNEDSDTVALEIIKPLELKPASIINLIRESSATKFIFYCDNIEGDSIFKGFNELRIELAIAQISTVKIVFISSIRENILERYKNISNMEIKNHIDYSFSGVYSDEELGLLLDNLKEVGLKSFRDVEEKKSIISEIKYKCNGEPFLILNELIESGEHHKSLEKAYLELDVNIKAAFKITSVIHRFNSRCPVSLVKNSIKDITWEEFTNKVIKGDGKNLLIQEHENSTNDTPDLFFRIRHSLIAKVFVEKMIKNSELNGIYKSIFNTIGYSSFNARFLVDLIKNIRSYDAGRITEGQIKTYFDLAKKEFQTSSHFMLAYVSNIERNTDSINALLECIKELEILEGDETNGGRNHRIIHRKGSIYFKIAKLLFKQKASQSEINGYIEIAEEWFDIKKRLDPGSDFSYLNYFSLLNWKLKHIKLDSDGKLELINKIYKLYDESKRILFTKVDQIEELFTNFKNEVGSFVDEDYLDFLQNAYRDPNTRVKASLALYNYYTILGDFPNAKVILEELKSYDDEKEVVIFLFKYYGRNLYEPNNRIKFFDLIRYNNFLEIEEPLRFNYFNSIAEFYDYRYDSGWEYLAKISKIKQGKLNPDFFLPWQDERGNEMLFEGQIVTDRKYKQVRVRSLSKTIPLVKDDYSKYKNGDTVHIFIRFLFSGLQAEINHIEESVDTDN